MHQDGVYVFTKTQQRGSWRCSGKSVPTDPKVSDASKATQAEIVANRVWCTLVWLYGVSARHTMIRSGHDGWCASKGAGNRLWHEAGMSDLASAHKRTADMSLGMRVYWGGKRVRAMSTCAEISRAKKTNTHHSKPALSPPSCLQAHISLIFGGTPWRLDQHTQLWPQTQAVCQAAAGFQMIPTRRQFGCETFPVERSKTRWRGRGCAEVSTPSLRAESLRASHG